MSVLLGHGDSQSGGSAQEGQEGGQGQVQGGTQGGGGGCYKVMSKEELKG
jgi:hypothetical protein